MEVEEYFDSIRDQTDKAYEIAEEARDQSKDPEQRVDIPVAEDLPEKASSLVIAAQFPELEDQGVADRIRELESEYGKNDERVAFQIGREIAQGNFYDFDDVERACDAGVRVGASYMTGGITTAPLEGIGDVKVRENNDGTEYLAVYYSGPIRSAGGTASAMSVLLADYVRLGVDLAPFKPSDTVVKRYAAEVDDYYTRVTAKQYYPEREETEMIAENVPVEVTGSPTEQLDVTNYKDLERVETNQIRGGMCLVYLDGLPLKAPKIKKRIEKWGKEFGLEHWEWVEDYLNLQEEIHSSGDDDGGSDEEESKYTPSDKFLGSMTAGRPVFGHPGKKGAFRLRYGHSRVNGLAAASVHPATMEITQRFIATGTQLKTEYPMKGTVTTPCDSIHPPIVRLENGNVVKVETRDHAREIEDEVEEILFLGDMLITYGEFVENGKKLLPSPYVDEWWEKELKQELERQEMELGRDFSDRTPSPEEAFKISDALGIPLHPQWTYHWRETSAEKFKELYKSLQKDEFSNKAKKALEDILLPHQIEEGQPVLAEEDRKIVDKLLALEEDNSNLLSAVEKPEDIPEFIKQVSGYEVKTQAPHYIGARMGRPEKAERRTIDGKPQIMFPCGKKEGGRMRNLTASYNNKLHKMSSTPNQNRGEVHQGILHNKCTECGELTYFSYCTKCNAPADPVWFCRDCGKQFDEKPEKCSSCGHEVFNRYKRTNIEVRELLDDALENLGMRHPPELLKSVRGMSGKHKHVEPLEKGLLREKYDLYVNKDGTVRYDATDIPMSHFKPKEISISVERLREQGYTHDVNGEPLENEEQVLELKPQDIILPDGENTLKASDYFVRVANFIDDLLEQFYGLEPYYNVESKEDLVGQLVIGLAPHTSGGTVGRIIGFTDAKGIYAHPYWHAAKRRNCLPGDEEVKTADGEHVELRELFQRSEGAEEADNTGTIEKDIDLEVITEEDGKMRSSSAKKVYRAPAQKFKIRFNTQSGREIEVFPDHRVKTSEGVKKARAVEEGDKLLTPSKIQVDSEDKEEIRISEFLETEDLMVGNATEVLNELIEEAGGLKNTADLLKMSKKTLGNYRYRERAPINILDSISEKVEEGYALPDKATVTAKRDTVELSNSIKVDKKFMKLLGYYLAEGYIRKSDKKGEEFYQVCFAFGEEELKNNMKELIEDVFGITPSEGDHILTISSRLIYELFEQFDVGKGAHSKRVPKFVKSLPRSKLRHMLSAYFAGDGSIEKGRLHVSATSVSRELLNDIDAILKRFGIFARYSTSERSAGGVLLDKYGKEHYKDRTFTSHKLHIRSSHAVRYGERIGFDIERKQEALEQSYSLERAPRLEIEDELVLDTITSREIIEAEERFMYDIEVEETHNFVTRENIITNNCDGDEDAILLLLDGLLNFSRDFLPDMTGARTMDAPLILSTVLNPDEVDDEAWAVETVSEYPLSFYEETKDYKYPWELDTDIEIGEDIVHSDEPFTHGFTHKSGTVEDAPNQSEYVTLDEMSEKTQSQLGIGEKLKAVNENEVAELLLQKHFIPDIKGNLRSFSKQKMRCVDCNTKFRRVPMTNQSIAPTGKVTAKCPECDGKVLLTISEGTIKKYMEPSKEIIDKYEINPYVRQQILILNKTLQSLFGKSNHQSGLKQFTS